MLDIAQTIFFLFFVSILWAFPFPLLYVFSNFVSWVMSRVFNYRRDVMLDNLRKCFPEADEKTINEIIRKTYRNLADILVEGTKAFTMTGRQIVRRHRIINPEVIKPYLESGRTFIGVAGHYGNWEWGSKSASLQLNRQVLAFYKPMKNRSFDRIVRRSHIKSGTTLVSIYETSAVFERYQNQTVVYLMAADQSPTNREKSYWTNFLGRDTAFLHGPEKYARAYNYPLVYVDVQRKKRGYYEIHLSVLADDPSQYKDGELTALYAKALEASIREKPENWLWSHRRWKMTR
jgi:KDO2-lipid IV(A) lauroyltransferase